MDPARALEPFRQGTASISSLEQLSKLYEQVLLISAGKNDEDRKLVRTVLGIIFVSSTTRPISVETISQLVHGRPSDAREVGVVRRIVRALHSVLYEDTHSNNAVRVHHASFLDFLKGNLRRLSDPVGIHEPSPPPSDWKSLEAIHELMFWGCISGLQGLEFNICGLNDASVLNRNLPDLRTRISQLISLTLQYGSLFWFTHLSNANLTPTGDVQTAVSDLMCTKRALFWLEVMSLLDAVGQSIVIAEQVFQYFRVRLMLSC